MCTIIYVCVCARASYMCLRYVVHNVCHVSYVWPCLLCFTYIFFMFGKCLAHCFMFDLCLAHVLHMFDIRFAYVFAYVWHKLVICLTDVFHMSDICMTYVWHMYDIHMSDICCTYVWHIYDMCLTYVLHTLDICVTFAWHVMYICFPHVLHMFLYVFIWFTYVPIYVSHMFQRWVPSAPLQGRGPNPFCELWAQLGTRCSTAGPELWMQLGPRWARAYWAHLGPQPDTRGMSERMSN